ncbi:MAG: cell division protein FtsZ [Hyphomicrobiaceae bacterium]
MSIKLQVPNLTELRPRIIVMGVGGAGGNAINNMIASGLEGVEFVAANTDAQALVASSAEQRIQLGANLTEGLGAGSKPEIGEAAAEEAVDEIRAKLSGAHMLFVAAGMGGGTGTGAAAVIARVAKEQGILVVGVVTKPFHFEGNRRMRMAEAGIAELKKHVDTLIVIPNQNLFRIANERTTFADAFMLADQILHAGVACVTDLIVKEGLINLDFADVRTVLSGMGSAMMGTGEATGPSRAIEAAEAAVANPLLDDVSLQGAKGLLVSISGNRSLTLYEINEAATRVRQEVDPEANIIVGATFDDNLNDRLRVSVVASGLEIVSGASGKPRTDPQLARRLSDALGAPQPAPLPPSAPRGPIRQGDTVFELGAPQMAQPQPRRAPEGRPPQEPDRGFTPQPPAEMRRSPRRMPEVDDFPPLAQRELRARQAGAVGAHGPVDKKRPGLFARLTGRLRESGDSRIEDQSESGRGDWQGEGPAPEASGQAAQGPQAPADASRPASRPGSGEPLLGPRRTGFGGAGSKSGTR